jgi:hypothetical protein
MDLADPVHTEGGRAEVDGSQIGQASSEVFAPIDFYGGETRDFFV